MYNDSPESYKFQNYDSGESYKFSFKITILENRISFKITILENRCTQKMIEIYSERLRLIPLDNQLLTIWRTQSRNAMETKLGLNSSQWQVSDFDRIETEDALINFWIPMTAEHQGDFFWFTNWDIVLESENVSIGGIGFAGFPDQDGVTMVGYFIDGNHREKGYATEALHCLINWAKLEPSLKTIIADTPFFNFPSQNVLKKAGFKEFSISEIEHLNEKIQAKNWRLELL